MSTKPTRALLDVTGILAVLWMAIASYESFTQTGLWSLVAHMVGGATTLAAQAAVLATCLLAGWLVIATAGWIAWRAFFAGRLDPDFPVARAQPLHIAR